MAKESTTKTTGPRIKPTAAEKRQALAAQQGENKPMRGKRSAVDVLADETVAKKAAAKRAKRDTNLEAMRQKALAKGPLKKADMVAQHVVKNTGQLNGVLAGYSRNCKWSTDIKFGVHKIIVSNIRGRTIAEISLLKK